MKSGPKETSEEQFKEWLKQNKSNIEIFQWNGFKIKSKFKDINKNIEFEYIPFRLKDKIKQYPNRDFGLSAEEYTKKSRQTLKENTGFEFALQNEQSKLKQKETMQRDYGVDNIFQLPEMQEVSKKWKQDNENAWKKAMQNAAKRRIKEKGYAYPMQNSEIAKVIVKKSAQTKIKNGKIKILPNGQSVKEFALEKHRSYAGANRLLHKHGFESAQNIEKHQTHIEMLMENFLKELNVSYEKEKRLYIDSEYKIPDFLIEEKKLIIECDGLYYHSEQEKSDDYHVAKKDFYEKLGYQSLFFRENELENKFEIIKSIIKNKLQISDKFNARDLELKILSDELANAFFNAYHLMGDGRSSEDLQYGLFLNDELVAAASFQYKNYKENIIDLARFATKSGHNIRGAFTKFLKRIIQEKKPNVIQTFVDRRYGSGEYLKNFDFVKKSQWPSFKWYKEGAGGKAIVHNRGVFKKNSGYLFEFIKIWDCGQIKYELTLDYADSTKWYNK